MYVIWCCYYPVNWPGWIFMLIGSLMSHFHPLLAHFWVWMLWISVVSVTMILYGHGDYYYVLMFFFLFPYSILMLSAISMQRHDIVKKRLDHLGKVIDSRKGDIGAPKVGNLSLSVHSFSLFLAYWINFFNDFG